jgi:rubredoxin
MARWECIVCGLIYDEKEGWPDDGIAPGTKWQDVPDDWTCPDCGVGKDDFELIPGSEDDCQKTLMPALMVRAKRKAATLLSLDRDWRATAWCASCAVKMTRSRLRS